ncbi:S49 family peptidase [Flavobacterium sp. LB2P84]|uniref:S49 family peptidase n=1 Tax=Flavobacterium yafengii TaxID=3041253 RepID=UPI0024A9834C|nr:S49 family peptidase [Flavobacterium yafengii]MDI6033024.1 S49 family peptidase [Flavobacterium yafengii]
MKICIVEINNTNFFALDKNTNSLLNSNWMFSGDSKNILMPFLLNILNNTKNEFSLNPTSFLQASHLNAVNPFDFDKPLENKVVAIIQVHHPIFKYDQMCGPKGTQTIMAILESWKSNDNIIGVVMDYNSGGGQGSGTREVARYIFEYPKPIVSYTNDLCGSAAFYLYSAAKYRFINQYADFIGCIGSMSYSIDLQGAIEKSGGKVNEFYADSSPEKNLQSRELKKGNERPLIEKMLNPNADLFHSDIKDFMPSISDKALKGDVFTPDEALKEGLADSFGTLQDAIDKVIELHNASDNSNSNSNTNNNMNTTQLPSLQSVLGLDAPLASTEENGTYLNAGQLETVENRLVELDASNTALQTQLDAALANTEAQEQLTAVNATVTGIEASIDGMLTSAGLDVTGTLTEKATALSAKVAEMGGKDGAIHTNPKVDVNNEATASNVVGGVDITGAMNN